MAVSKQTQNSRWLRWPSSRPPNKSQPLTLRPSPSMHWRVQIRSPTGSTYMEGDTLSAAFTFLCAYPCFQVLACDVDDERQLIQFLQRNWLMDWIKKRSLVSTALARHTNSAFSLLVFSLPSSLDTLTATPLGPSGRRRRQGKMRSHRLGLGHLYI